jgi:ATP-dependent RNA helicase DDX3X
VEVHGTNVPSAIVAFSDLKLSALVKTNVDLAHYTKPTPVQKNALPAAIVGRDVMACAQTGSGKTAAFLIPLVVQLLAVASKQPHQSKGKNVQWPVAPYGLILAPTRELAIQIHEEAEKFTYRTGQRAHVVYGGVNIAGQIKELSGGCEIMVATPGRLIDLLEQKYVTLSKIAYLVLDEADRMLDMGFEKAVRKIVEKWQMPRQRQTLMFSATFPYVSCRVCRLFVPNLTDVCLQC